MLLSPEYVPPSTNVCPAIFLSNLVTAEDTAMEGSLMHEFKNWEFHIAEFSDSGVFP